MENGGETERKRNKRTEKKVTNTEEEQLRDTEIKRLKFGQPHRLIRLASFNHDYVIQKR